MRSLTRAAAVLAVALVVGDAAGQSGGLEETPLIMSLVELEDEISRREADLRRYGAQLELLESRNAELQHELERHEAELRVQESQARARIVTLCRLRHGGAVQLLRGARTWSDLIRRARVARFIADGDVTALRSHQGRVEALAERRRELESRLQSQRALRSRIATYQQELEVERHRRLRRQQEPDFPQSTFFHSTGEAATAPAPLGL